MTLENKWSLSISVFSLVVAIGLGFKTELINHFAVRELTIDLSESPYVFTRFGKLKFTLFTSIRANLSREVEIEGAELELRSADGTNLIKMPAEYRQVMFANQMILLPFNALSTKDTQPIAEFITFGEPISDTALSQIVNLEHKANSSAYAKQYPEVVPKSATENTLSTDSPSQKAANKKGYNSTFYPVYTTPKISPYAWPADASLLQEGEKLFGSNFKLGSGSYTVTFNVFGKGKEILATRKYSLTVLDGQVAAIRENWFKFFGKMYSGAMPPTQEIALRLRPINS